MADHMAAHKREKVKILIEKFENHMTIDVHPHGSNATPAETEKNPHSLDYSMITRESHGGNPPVYNRTFKPRETTVARGRSMATDRQPPYLSCFTDSGQTTDENKKIISLYIPFLELKSATLEYIDSDRDTCDPGIYVKSVMHRGEAGKADDLVVHDQLTEVNGVSLIGLSKGPAMNTLHRAIQMDGPIHGHIQLRVVRKDSSSVTHIDNADDFVYGPNDQTFRETHHAKYSPTRDISSPESHKLDCLDLGDIVGSNLPINPHINERQYDYHHTSFQHKPMQKSDFRMDSNAMMQKQVKETESGSRHKPTFPHKNIQQSIFGENPNVVQMSQMKMRSSPMPPDSYRPRSEVLEQQPSLLSWEDSDAQNKMESCPLEWSQQGIKEPLLIPEMSDVSSLKDFKCHGYGQQSTTEKETDHLGEIYQREKSEQQQVFTSSVLNGNEIRIVILGKTGVGKSATGNTILGGKFFKSEPSASSITGKCKQRSSNRFGHTVVVVDTPGSFDTIHTNEYIQEEICRCVAITSPGPHAFILVLNASRFTPEEQHSVNHFVKYFGDNIYKFIIILFTRKDDLDEGEKTVFEYIRSSPPELRHLINQCGGRYIAFNNRLKGQERDKQARELLYLVLENVRKNNNEYYTNEMYEEAEKILIEKERQLEIEAMEKHRKELKAIEENIAKKYEMQIAIDAEKLQHANELLDSLIMKQQTDDERISLLTKQVEAFEKQVKGSEGDKKQEMQQRLDMMQKELENVKNISQKEEQEIKKLKKSKQKAQKEFEELHAQQKEEQENMEKKFTEKFNEQKRKNRKEIRDEIEKSDTIVHAIGTAFSWVKNKFFGLFKK